MLGRLLSFIAPLSTSSTRNSTSSLSPPAASPSTRTSSTTIAPISGLPPELLRYILSLACRFPPSPLAFDSFDHRIESLLALALVHSTWKPIAQDLLGEEIWIGRYREGRERTLDRLKDRGRKIRPQKVTTNGSHPGFLLHEGGNVDWSQVRDVQELDVHVPRSLRDYAVFSRLETLSVHFCSLDVSASPDPPFFPHLRRLVLCGSHRHAEIASDDSLLTRARFPKLAHLSFAAHLASLGAFDQIFPQLETLGIHTTGDPSNLPGLYTVSDDVRSLRHFCLRLDDFVASSVFYERLIRLNLESLHFDLERIKKETLGAQLLGLSEVAKEREGAARTRVVIYGSRMLAEWENVDLDLNAFEWRKERLGPTFQYFDGT